MVNLKTAQRKWWMHFLIVIIGFSLGSCLITLGLFAPIPPNSCNTSFVITVFDGAITGELTTTTPNITTHLGSCSTIAISSTHDNPFTLQIIDHTGYPYLSVPNFSNYTTQTTRIEVTLYMRDYSLVALRESTNAAIELQVTASYKTLVLPCIDYQAFTIRYGLPIIGILFFLLSSYSTLRLYQILQTLSREY